MRDSGCNLSFSLHHESQSAKKNSAEQRGTCNYDENAVKTVSKCLARMKACWGPEIEPSVEKIMDYQ